ncbi:MULTISPECIES: chromate efflux transporter [unclassified Rhizobium]|uniref:chromate efflux transporter n=1 Tax=unclassified Rhizobium TaxID=2613769 RepID=UPI0007EB018D|nr:MULTISPECIES: chromate efflux transporter [unclassified Rhizobium]ANM11227.1 chromate transporter protein [Rhizobium sp. N324]ANM17772.1 chromate transporter protein [Rhizobium sp. N541]ANM24158.1 chromate transporter protein [Rhizobium sp. N941]OYD04828.1 chromate transporter protein [Rhizobium sp. N4311]
MAEMTDNGPAGKMMERNAGEGHHHGVSFGEALKVWLRVAALSFGGPAGQIAVMHRIVVDEKRWIGEHRFLHALNYCMLLPGPEAQQLAVYIGWLMHRTLGGLVAGLLFVLPGFLSILCLSYIYAAYGSVGIVAGLFFGLKAAVLAVVVQAVIRIGSRALRNKVMLAIAAAAFVAIFLFHVPFPLIVLAAAIAGFLGGRLGLAAFQTGGGHKAGSGAVLSDAESALGEGIPDHARPNLGWSLRISALLLALWLVPVAALYAAFGAHDVFTEIGLFFSKMAVVTFGGAYAALAYVAQEAVQRFGWLKPGEMLDGLGMAETTPGPLIMVLQFVGFMGAYRNPGSLDPMLAATLAAILTTWVTFVPCFLWIFLGAPFIEKLRGNVALAGAMSAITAAVVGVILNLAIWFGLHTLFADVATVHLGGLRLDIPVLQSAVPAAMALSAAAAIAIFRFKTSVITTLLACAISGMLWTLAVS